ncbi:putative acyl-CoA reductase [Minicystis rosea]|nr:putative acyl-CoA reductase [Minicystis rosea]
MSDSTDARRARIARTVAIARRVADRDDPLGKEARAELAVFSGLSAEGVELALTEHLEIDPSAGDLDALLASVATAPRCHVVLAANVCTAALRAIACATATAPAIFVRPSRRDPVLAAILTRELAADPAFRAAGGSIARIEEIKPTPGDELHIYGSDETVAAISASVARGVVVRGHGTGLGLAVVGAGIGVDVAAPAIARDVVPFDQRGCLSPRAVLVEGGVARASAFAEALAQQLATLGARVPRGPLDEATAADVTRYRATIEAIGVVHRGADHVVGLDPEPRALILPPTARVVHVVPVEAAEVAALLTPWAAHVTCFGAGGDGDLVRAVQALGPRARCATLGRMQKPPLDGPVDLRHREREDDAEAVAAQPGAGYRMQGS